MARSVRKSPYISWTTAKSEKSDKRVHNRRMRSITKCKLRVITAKDEEMETVLLPRHLREITNVWDWAKDGRCWIPSDSSYFKKAMRK